MGSTHCGTRLMHALHDVGTHPCDLVHAALPHLLRLRSNHRGISHAHVLTLVRMAAALAALACCRQPTCVAAPHCVVQVYRGGPAARPLCSMSTNPSMHHTGAAAAAAPAPPFPARPAACPAPDLWLRPEPGP